MALSYKFLAASYSLSQPSSALYSNVAFISHPVASFKVCSSFPLIPNKFFFFPSPCLLSLIALPSLLISRIPQASKAFLKSSTFGIHRHCYRHSQLLFQLSPASTIGSVHLLIFFSNFAHHTSLPTQTPQLSPTASQNLYLALL